MKRKFIHISAIFALVSGLSSCSGILDGIYDDAQPDSTFEEGFHGTESTSFTLRLDATSYDNWIYINLADRSIERMPIPSTITGRWDGRSAWYTNLWRATDIPNSTISPPTRKPSPRIGISPSIISM